MPEYAADTLTERENARIIKTAVTPRPIAWISSRDADGNENLAPFSSYNYVVNSDPVIMFTSPAPDSGSMKDTARNILETEEFAVNVVTATDLETMDRTAASLPAEESEFDYADVAKAPCRHIEPDRVEDAAVTMECTLYDTLEIRGKLMILGDVIHYHIAERTLRDGNIDSREVDTVGRLGGPYYTVAVPEDFERQF